MVPRHHPRRHAGLYYALDPKALAVLLLVTTVLAIDPRECLMPFIVNAFKLVDLSGVRIGTTAICCTVALPVTLYFQYDRGMNKLDTWATQNPPKFASAETIRVRQRLIAQDKLEATESVSGWQRLRHLSPRGPLLIALAAGASLVAVCTFCRLHFPRWPIHPVVFLVWATYPGAVLAGSFLLLSPTAVRCPIRHASGRTKCWIPPIGGFPSERKPGALDTARIRQADLSMCSFSRILRS